MIERHLFFSKSLVTFTCSFITLAVCAGGPPPTAQECEDDLIVAAVEMDFLSFVGGIPGTIDMDTTGVMIHSGVFPVGGATMGVPATFTLTAVGKNCDKRDVIFSIISTTVTMTSLSGPETINITNLVHDLPTNPFQIRDLAPNYQIKIGGTLTATGGEPAATFRGPVNVSFTFQ